MKTRLDYLVRIKQVVKDKGMLKREGFNLVQEEMILGFITENQEKLRELSLRMVIKLAGLLKMNPTEWRKLASVTCMRGN
jgi:sensor histidine kinase regulating citrate/malate metabolism